MKRLDSFTNSMAVVNYLMTYYPKEVVSYTKYCCTIEVTVHLPWEDYDSKREKERLENIVLADAIIEIFSNTQGKTDVIHIEYGIL